jgi:hypothetical protein
MNAAQRLTKTCRTGTILALEPLESPVAENMKAAPYQGGQHDLTPSKP